jgi:hypothetical protein
MKKLIIPVLLALSVTNALAHDSITFADGDYCTVGGNPEMILCTNKNRVNWHTAYAQGKYAGAHLHDLTASPDGNYLYFIVHYPESPGAGVFQVNMKTLKTTSLIEGDLDCVVSGGPFKGDIIVTSQTDWQEDKTYYYLHLLTPSGKEVPVRNGRSGFYRRLVTPSGKVVGHVSGGNGVLSDCSTFGEYN